MELLYVNCNPFMLSISLKGKLANSVDPDQTPQIAESISVYTFCILTYQKYLKTNVVHLESVHIRTTACGKVP